MKYFLFCFAISFGLYSVAQSGTALNVGRFKRCTDGEKVTAEVEVFASTAMTAEDVIFRVCSGLGYDVANERSAERMRSLRFEARSHGICRSSANGRPLNVARLSVKAENSQDSEDGFEAGCGAWGGNARSSYSTDDL